jgi:nucleoside-diphosphate-sugar epimerase
MDMKDQLNIDETYPLPKRFVNLYSETKAAAENLVLAANSHHFLTTALRPRAIWGPRDRSGFLPQIVSAMAKGKLRDISGGNKILASLCHAENAAEACILASQSSAVGGKDYFITDQEVVDVWEFASKLAALFEVQPIRKKINPFLARSIARGFDSIWKIPGLSNHYAPPISSYRVGLLTLSGTFSTRSAERDFGYKARMSQEVGLSRLKHWINSAGGVASLGR